MRNTDETDGIYTFEEEIKPVKGKGISYRMIAVICIIASVIIGAIFGTLLGGSGEENTPKNTADIVDSSAEPENNAQDDTADDTQNSAAPTDAAAQTSYSGSADLIDVIAEAKRNGMIKRCYLTFDDGPSSKVTPQILDVLAKYDIKATFFEVGKNIETYPEMTKRVYDEGHLIANHSYTHDFNSLYASADSFRNEIEECENAIKEATGHDVEFKLLRFPGGSYDAGDHAKEKQVYKEIVADMGYYYCDWNTLNGDAEGAQKDTAQLIEFFKASAEQYISQDKNLIVLMHDTDAKQPTADALETIIVYMMERGYTFHRLDDITL